ncbi:MAG: NAD(+) diphosphatase [Alphaproteobacteria bacterium]|nr:NAD(+) diphosphatase [Alphaproteobacteria bacterium]
MLRMFYTHPAIDRADGRRGDADWVAAQRARADMRVLPVWRGKNMVTGPREAPQPVFASAADDWWQAPGVEPALIGLIDGVPYFAADVSAVEDPRRDPALAGIGAFVDLRTCGPLLPPAAGGLFAHARALTWFHLRHRYCGACGRPTESRQGGQMRACPDTGCRAEFFPRVDPAVIVLVHDGARVLLARQHGFPRGLHALLAGFLEPVETLEACVAREVYEETGLELAEIRYFASQPWPFPQSLMLGFVARAAGTELVVDPAELTHAAWYTPDFLRAQKGGRIGRDDFALPGPDSIARLMLDAWLDGML